MTTKPKKKITYSTDKALASLKPKAERYPAWDVRIPGLGVRITPKGIKTFNYVYHFDKKSTRLTIGRYRSAEDIKSGQAADGVNFMTLNQSRKAAIAAREKIERGINPGAEKQEAKELERKAETINELAEIYIELHAEVKKRTWKEDQRILNHDVKPVWGKRKAKSITPADAIKLLDDIAARPAPIMANRVHSLLSKMFRWSIPRGYVASNPVEFIEKPGQEKMRERALSAGEIKKFWDGVADIDYSDDVKLALKLLLVTGQRRGEVAGIETAELDEAGGIWTIPGARTKNGRSHAVPLSDLALKLIREARMEAGDIEGCKPEDVTYLFPAWSRKNKLQSLRPDKLTTAMTDEAKNMIGRQLSPHDLRRTASTLMGAEPLSVPRFVRDKILNHSDRSPGAHYDVNEYLSEKREALKVWGIFIAEKVEQPSGKVVAIGGRRK